MRKPGSEGSLKKDTPPPMNPSINQQGLSISEPLSHNLETLKRVPKGCRLDLHVASQKPFVTPPKFQGFDHVPLGTPASHSLCTHHLCCGMLQEHSFFRCVVDLPKLLLLASVSPLFLLWCTRQQTPCPKTGFPVSFRATGCNALVSPCSQKKIHARMRAKSITTVASRYGLGLPESPSVSAAVWQDCLFWWPFRVGPHP